ncbi:MAG: DUF1640 domain-containing protein, partial [bacterium]|nr:DUF1640 domain-containing protein [bacterium]
YAFVKKLKESGVPEEQAGAHAEAIAHLIEDRLATRQDLESLEASLKRDLKELELRLLIRLGALIATAVAIVAALVKLL